MAVRVRSPEVTPWPAPSSPLPGREAPPERALAILLDEVVAAILERLSGVLVQQGHAGMAAQLLGAADALREVLPTQPRPADRRDRDRAAAAARRTLGAEAWASAFAIGRELSLDRLIADTLAPWLVADAPTRSTAGSFGLTERECEVLAMLCLRLTDQEIAERLSISRRTSSAHVAHILGKLGAANRREAAAVAVRLGIAP